MNTSSNPDLLIQWLYTNAPAAWISTLVATVTCVYVLWSRKRPNIIIVQDITHSSLIRVWPSIREKIKLTFNDQPITTLGQIDLKVFNNGSDVIKDSSFEIMLPKDSKILGAEIEPQDAIPKTAIKDNCVVVAIQHLNPAREHDQFVYVSILVDGETSPLKVTGSGMGWSSCHLPIPTERQSVIQMAIFFAFLIVITLIYGKFVKMSFGIGIDEISIRAFISAIPLLLLFIAVMILRPRWLGLANFLKSPRRLFVSGGDDKQ